jgi:hypothetical protein
MAHAAPTNLSALACLTAGGQRRHPGRCRYASLQYRRPGVAYKFRQCYKRGFY